ncbi:hypothetical protein PVAND_008239 [Polypedilum vanderplanki]|uniref:Cap-specific mRNA (nucleoside-2'-O-)-methyltransferase 2 n=1 Tax=Polypedilum vanderplanki TaxID=319348 RepID=A0A9J6C920_POLVA|nr:hypothetical protein PVAND_008239 [Polypedilum vanderplanki]
MDFLTNFNKKFNFTNENYKLPPIDYFYSTDSEAYDLLEKIKNELNAEKSKLNDKKIENWSRHTRQNNPAQLIVHHLREVIKGEFVTQAFAKFFECLNTYPLINENVSDKLFSVHLCEAPGAFITSLNHFLKINYPNLKFIWRATTLNPYYEGNSISNTILDDRFILHTFPNWIFGESFDGDILCEDNIKSLIANCNKIGNVMLVTCDGSIDCLDKPENQEEVVSKLHAAEFITSLALLADDGSLLIKLFTFFESTTVALLYVLNCCFKHVHIFKPVTSKEGNSEVYVIGLNFKKDSISSEYINYLIKNFMKEKKSMLPLNSIPKSFLKQIVDAAKYFKDLQVSVIKKNLDTFMKFDKHRYDKLKLTKKLMLQEYLRRYNMRPIEKSQKLMQGIDLIDSDINLNERVHSGSHLERQSFKSISHKEQLDIFYIRLQELYQKIINQPILPNNRILSTQSITNFCSNPKEFIKLIRGKPIEQVVSSKFIMVSLFKFFIELKAFLNVLSYEESSFSKNNFVFDDENLIKVEMKHFRKAENYDKYEKDVILKILLHLFDTKCKDFIIENLPLLTQFMVGIVLYLAIFAYDEVKIDIDSRKIILRSLRDDGNTLKYLIKMIENDSTGIIGICDTILLFMYNNGNYYKSIIDYNNRFIYHMCSLYITNIQTEINYSRKK